MRGIFMKKIIVTSIILILMTIFAGTVLAKTGTVNTQGLKFRDGASTVDTNIIKKLDKGTTLNILEEVEGGWYKVTFEDKNGYVKKEYIDVTNDDTGTTTGETGIIPNEPNNEPTSEDNCKIISDTDIYVLPLINSTKISKIKANTNITIISENGNWKYIQSEDKLGWVIASKVKDGKAQSGEPQGNQANNVNENNTVSQENTTTQNNTVPVVNTTSSENTITTQTTENQTLNQNTVGDNSTQTPNNSSFPRTMYVNVEAVNIRRAATTSSDIIDRIELNTPVTVTGEEGNWYKVTWNNIKAYIRNDFLSMNKK